MKYKANVTSLNLAQETPMMIACREGKMDIVKQIVRDYSEFDRFSIESKNLDGWTAIMFAAFNGHLCIVDYLV